MSFNQALTFIKSVSADDGITLIALTGWGQENDRQKAIDAGFDRHLTKPIDPDALESLIGKRLATGRGVTDQDA